MNTKEKLVKIKKVLKSNIGKGVLLTIKRSKEEYIEVKGVINDVFSSFFTVEIVTEENKKRVCSYSYFDVLTSVVSLKAS
ncbi:MAG: Veg family protein [Peptoniphilaceae bacterium]|uniref:Veg family protein n=1 Tax=Parvimonas sp. TaxID=1944660 RepID=UPI0025F1E9F7|nr:Veg family protein [Parvimonas sp.]MCI5996890.1 Veg family protein [Parvimonas sp.]MDD7764712.1 Veg family protein [Peptoniphilaceae bacterium]MDY3051439.1 Veg family protein [Parvimonas sp.]